VPCIAEKDSAYGYFIRNAEVLVSQKRIKGTISLYFMSEEVAK
jgi:hypothetical protein